MREIGSVADEKAARLLADYLLTLNITTRIDPRPGSWAIWVHREDRVDEARAVLADFQANPADPRFSSAPKAAREIRKEAEKVEKKYRKRVKDLRERWEGAMYHRAPLAFALIAASVAIYAVQMIYPRVYHYLWFSPYKYDEQLGYYRTVLVSIAEGQVWRLITPIFIHLGLLHIFFNMSAMRYLGERIEMRKGTWRFALIVLVSALASNVGQSFVSGGGFGGMSGVVFALAGYLWIKGHTDPGDGLSLSHRSAQWMIGWFLLGIIAPLTAGRNAPDSPIYHMANVAHGVGLAVGVVFGIFRF